MLNRPQLLFYKHIISHLIKFVKQFLLYFFNNKKSIELPVIIIFFLMFIFINKPTHNVYNNKHYQIFYQPFPHHKQTFPQTQNKHNINVNVFCKIERRKVMENKKQVQTKVSNFLEFDGMQISVEEIRDKILNRHSDEKIRELQIYYNIEEFKAYYVINGVHEKEYYVDI